NVVAPMPYVEKYGADAVRYWAASSSLGEDCSFQEKEIVTGARTINKMWNVARFISMTCSERSDAKSDNPMDYWISCKLSTAVRKATDSFERYDYFKARVAAEELFWSFANDYLEFIKYRVYGKDTSANRTANETMLSLLKMFAPFMPFATEEMYKNVFEGNANVPADGGIAKSIHLSAWPVGNEFDEEKFRKADGAVKLILFIRKWKHDNAMALNAELSEIVV